MVIVPLTRIGGISTLLGRRIMSRTHPAAAAAVATPIPAAHQSFLQKDMANAEFSGF
jgi:hypothetical protein